MRTFLILWKQEVATYFRTPLAYVILFFFLLLMGFNFYASVDLLNHGSAQVSIVEAFFNTIFFWMSFLFLCPLLTMRLFAEEYRSGSIETLMTAPVRSMQVVLAKFLGAFFLFVMLWVPTIFYFILFWPSAHQVAAASYGSYMGAYGMLLLLGMFYLSVGCLSSVMTSHQLIAGMISFCLMVIMFFIGMTSFLHRNRSPQFRELVSFFSPMEHMTSFSRGLIDTRPIVWYMSMTAFVLFLTLQIFQSRKWRR
ncbi:MAG: ABC transporter permease [Chthoniobacterales bacterium]